jgi:hypothetical protein
MTFLNISRPNTNYIIANRTKQKFENNFLLKETLSNLVQVFLSISLPIGARKVSAL